MTYLLSPLSPRWAMISMSMFRIFGRKQRPWTFLLLACYQKLWIDGDPRRTPARISSSGLCASLDRRSYFSTNQMIWWFANKSNHDSMAH
jgi:hypothetical protein